jgi:hypothetical protein
MGEPEDKPQGRTRGPITFTTAIRAFVLDYYRRVARGKALNGNPETDDTGQGGLERHKER